MNRQLAQVQLLWQGPDMPENLPNPNEDVFMPPETEGVTPEQTEFVADPLPQELTAPLPWNLTLPEHFANLFPTLLTASTLFILGSLVISAVLLILGRNKSRLAHISRIFLVINLVGLAILIALRIIFNSYFSY